MRKEDIWAKLNAHKKWLTSDDVDSDLRFVDSEVDFLKENWADSSMSCTILFDSNFDDCDLTSVDFFQAELQGSTFVNAKMANVILTKANIDGCTFNGAELKRAAAKRIDSVDVDFVAASLTETDFGLSKFIRGNFNRAKLIGADFGGVILDDCSFCGADLSGAKGLNTVRINSGIKIGSVDAPRELKASAARDWLASQSR